MLGLVQGATELLPISSSGHLILVPWLFDWDYLKENDAFNQTFDVSLHLGTLVAVVLYFRADLVRLAAAWLGTLSRRRIETVDERIAWCVAAATVGGDRGRRRREPDRRKPRRAVADRDQSRALRSAPLRRRQASPDEGSRRREHPRRRRRRARPITGAHARGVVVPGITITAGRFLGLDRDSAARFSFLLLVPITLGAIAYKGIGDVLLVDLPPGMIGPFVVGSLASFAAGLAAISALLGYVRRHNYTLFVVYRLVLAAIILLLIATGVRAADF